MQITSAVFVKSSAGLKDCPPPDKPEYAFIGRSNVGKSSLINNITQRRSLAKTSSTPGKTQLINHFLINDAWYLTDLPGFGFAKVSKDTRLKWEKMIMNYLIKRDNLLNTFLLVDSRHAPLATDLQFISWFGEQGLPFCLVFTKTDKLSQNKIRSNFELYKKKLSEDWDPLPPVILSSSTTGLGRDAVLEVIAQANTSFEQPKLV